MKNIIWVFLELVTLVLLACLLTHCYNNSENETTIEDLEIYTEDLESMILHQEERIDDLEHRLEDLE